MFTGNEDNFISLEEAQVLTENYRTASGENAIMGGYFSKTTVQNILNQEGCTGLKYYYGTDDNGKPQLIILGVNKNGDDMIGGLLGDRSMPCPPYCGSANVLNS